MFSRRTLLSLLGISVIPTIPTVTRAAPTPPELPEYTPPIAKTPVGTITQRVRGSTNITDSMMYSNGVLQFEYVIFDGDKWVLYDSDEGMGVVKRFRG